MFSYLEEKLSCKSSFSDALENYENNMNKKYKNLLNAVNTTKDPLKNISNHQSKEKNNENVNIDENNNSKIVEKKSFNYRNRYNQLKSNYSKSLLRIIELENNCEILKNLSIKSINNSKNYENLYIKLEKDSLSNIKSLKEKNLKTEKENNSLTIEEKENHLKMMFYLSKIESYERLFKQKREEIKLLKESNSELKNHIKEKKEKKRKLSIEICNTFNYQPVKLSVTTKPIVFNVIDTDYSNDIYYNVRYKVILQFIIISLIIIIVIF